MNAETFKNVSRAILILQRTKTQPVLILPAIPPSMKITTFAKKFVKNLVK
jgi:hypothetical protein